MFDKLFTFFDASLKTTLKNNKNWTKILKNCLNSLVICETQNIINHKLWQTFSIQDHRETENSEKKIKNCQKPTGKHAHAWYLIDF